MNLYLISQKQNTDWDTYDAVVVCAPSEEAAKLINPNRLGADGKDDWDDPYSSWCSSPEQVSAELIGTAAEGQKEGIVLAAFNAG